MKLISDLGKYMNTPNIETYLEGFLHNYHQDLKHGDDPQQTLRGDTPPQDDDY